MSRVTLTPEIAAALEGYWELSGTDTLTDEEICLRVGITLGQLTGWLKRNTKVEWKGKKESLRHIRARARHKTKTSYLQRMVVIMAEAHQAAQQALRPPHPGQSPNYHGAAAMMKVASDQLKWLLERQFPKEFNPARMMDLDKLSGQGGVLVVPAGKSVKQWLDENGGPPTEGQ